MMETQARALSPVNAMPAPTWHSLKANCAAVEVPAGLTLTPAVTAKVPAAARGRAGAFETALAEAQEEWERTHPAPTVAERAEQAAFMAAEADATYGGTAQSPYQRGADALEEARSLSAAFEQGTGVETAAFVHDAAGERIVVHAAPGAHADAQVLVSAIPGAVSAAAIDIVAGEGASVRLSLVVGAGHKEADTCARGGNAASERGSQLPDTGTHPPASGLPAPAGITGTTMRVFAGRGAEVEIARMQALDDGFDDIDDMGLFTAAGAHVSVRQTVLGAGKSFTGLAGDLRGDASRIDIETRYLGEGTRELDFNYALRHHGHGTECNLQANGVLAGRSKKTLRGTIDLVRGCKGSAGQENETVLLVDDEVRNLTVPVILCNEDDVSGNHGATIGHIREEQLFYLGSRGLSPEAAERMFAHAMLEQAALDAADDEAYEAVMKRGESLDPGFRALFEEEA